MAYKRLMITTVITFNLLASEVGQIAPGQMRCGVPGKCS